jgi:hypothetical protein
MAQRSARSTAEAFAVGRRAPASTCTSVIAVTTVGAVNRDCSRPWRSVDGDFAVLRFELDNARKDLRYYTHLAEGLTLRRSSRGRAPGADDRERARPRREFVPSLVQAQVDARGRAHRRGVTNLVGPPLSPAASECAGSGGSAMTGRCCEPSRPPTRQSRTPIASPDQDVVEPQKLKAGRRSWPYV